MNARPESHEAVSARPGLRTGQGAGWLAKSGSRPPGRISPQNAVVVFALFDHLFLVASCYMPTLVEPRLTSFGDMPMDRQTGGAALALILYALLARAFGTYSTKNVFDFEYAAKRLLIALLLAFSALLFISGAVKVTNVYSRLWFFSWAGLALTVPLAFRYAGLARIRWRMKAGDFVFKAVSASLFCEPLAASRIRAQSRELASVVATMPLKGISEIAILADSIGRDEIDQIYLTVKWADAPRVLAELAILATFGG